MSFNILDTSQFKIFDYFKHMAHILSGSNTPPTISFVKISLLIICGLCFSSSKICGQNTSLINYSIHEGLPSSEVYQIHCDKNGFLWFATDNGVARFDGKEFERFNIKDSLSDPIVFGFHEDARGRIWFRTFTGKLSFYDGGEIHKYQYNNITSKLAARAIITDLHCDSLNNLLLSVGSFIGIDSMGQIVKKNEIEPGVLEYKVLPGKEGILGSLEILKKIKKIKILNTYHDIQLSDTTQWLQSSYSITWNNKIYIALNTDIFEYTNSTLKKVFTATAPIISLSKIDNDEVWIGLSNQGVIKTSLLNFNKSITIPELKSRSVSKVLKDLEGGYWIATLEKGVFYIPNFEIQSIPFKTTSRVRAIGYVNNSVLIGDYAGNVMAENPANGTIRWNKKFNSAITSIFVSTDSSIWVSHLNGTTVLYKDGSQKYIISNASFIDFSHDNESFIWGLNSYGLHLFSNYGHLLMSKRLDVWNRNITKDGNHIYVSGRNGLHRYDTLFENEIEVESFKNYKISKVLPISENYLLITTTGNGFFLWDKEQQTISYSSYGNFISNNVYDAISYCGSIWIATENGIAVCSEKSLVSKKPLFDIITKQNGLISNKINQLSIGNHKILAFADEGYSSIPEPGSHFEIKIPIPYIKYFLVNNKKQNFSKPMVLLKSENDIEIGVGFLAYSNQNIYSRFRINRKNVWTLSINRIFQFNSLDEGDYVFDLEYSLDNLNWIEAPLHVYFTILPPWWNSWYFRSASFLIALAIGVTFYRYRVAQYKQRNNYLSLINDQQKKLLNAEIEATEQERSRIARDLHDGISIDLISIKLITDRIAKKVAPEETYEVENQVQKTILEIRRIIHGLNPPELNLFGLATTIHNYLLVVEKNHPISITFDFKGEEVKDERISTVIFRIVQELTTNSIKHAHCHSINLHINVFADTINVSYDDDGHGFNPDAVNRGLGLTNIESRIGSLGGQLQFESGEFGSSYSIDIPLGNNSKKK